VGIEGSEKVDRAAKKSILT